MNSSARKPLVLPPALQQSIQRGECVAFIGSGVSSKFYHSWDELVNRLCRSCGSDCTVSSESPVDEFLDAAEDARNRDIETYHRFLGDHFGCSIDGTNPLYRAILSCNFKSYLTTNFDPLLASEARSATPICRTELMVYPNLDRQYIGNRTIYYLHGYIAEHQHPVNGAIVLSRSEFAQAYEDNSSLSAFLIPTLENDPVCFVGCTLSEPPLAKLFEAVKKHQSERMILETRSGIAPGTPPFRYILLPERTIKRTDTGVDARTAEPDRERMASEDATYESLDIQVLRYSTSTEGDHWALKRAFEDLAGFCDPVYAFGWNRGD